MTDTSLAPEKKMRCKSSRDERKKSSPSVTEGESKKPRRWNFANVDKKEKCMWHRHAYMRLFLTERETYMYLYICTYTISTAATCVRSPQPATMPLRMCVRVRVCVYVCYAAYENRDGDNIYINIRYTHYISRMYTEHIYKYINVYIYRDCCTRIMGEEDRT